METHINIKYRGDLYKLLDIFNLPMKVLECGTAEGRFSQEIYNWDVSELYLVDIWERIPFIDGCASFEQEWHDVNYKRVKNLFNDKVNVRILKGFSHKMAELIEDESLGMIYIDAAHDYNSVKSDIASWWPKLVHDGIMAFHDYANPDYGVKRAVIEHIGGESNVNVIEENGSIENIGAWIQKT